MKHKFLIAVAAFFIAAAAQAQSTVDSIAAKYKLMPMPDSLTTESAFPVLGTYTINNANDSASNLSITLDPSNKGVIWVEGLPQGRVKAYLRQSPSTYRILPQKSESGKQVAEGTLIFDPAANTLNVEIGKAYDETNPASVFTATSGVDASTTTNDAASGTGTKTVKTKTKTATSKSKAKVYYYTATKVQTGMSDNANSSMNTNNQSATTDSTTHQ